MDKYEQMLTKAELLPLYLREIYEKYGYSKYNVAKFEPYDLYSENRSFLGNANIITFTEPSGRLMALKPDITIGMIKNTDPDTRAKKLYYSENVYRSDRLGGDFTEIRQTGLEYIGCDSLYAESEVVFLACKSLEAISGDYVLAVNHMGYIMAMLALYGFNEKEKQAVLSAIREKNSDELAKIAYASGLTEEKAALFCKSCVLFGDLKNTAELMLRLSETDTMRQAAQELKALCDALTGFGGFKGKVILDLSVMNDFEYYNGLVFRGYVRGIPKPVLAGGRYDSMMKRLGKPQNAAGFALYLSELDRYFHKPVEYDADILLVYGNASAARAAQAAQELVEKGYSVIVDEKDFGDIRTKEVIRLEPMPDTENIR